MKRINTYITEKLKLNKDTELEDTMYYIVPRGDMFKECKENYELIRPNNVGDYGFILHESDIKYLLGKYYHRSGNNIEIYKIPQEYKDKLDLFKNDIEKWKVKIEDLLRLENEEFK